MTTASPIGPDRAQAIERGLAKVTGRTVRLGVRTDPSLIGGVVARIGAHDLRRQRHDAARADEETIGGGGG